MRTLQLMLASALAVTTSILPLASSARGDEPSARTYDAYGYSAPQSNGYNWSGFYLGAHIERGQTRSDGSLDTRDVNFGTGALEPLSWSTSAWMVGAHVGYQHQWGPIVAGAEFGYSPLNSVLRNSSTGAPGLNVTTRANDLYLVSAKLGYAAGRSMIYGRAGWATTNLSASTDGNYASSTNGKVNGWSGGVGFDYAITKGVILGAEYGVTRLESQTFTLTDGATISTLSTGGMEFQSFKLRVDLKFN